MTEIPPRRTEFNQGVDKDGDFSETKILAVVDELKAEGKNPQSIVRALLRVLLAQSSEQDIQHDTAFLTHARKVFDESIRFNETLARALKADRTSLN